MRLTRRRKTEPIPRGTRWWVARIVARPADRLILRRQLRSLKRFAERDHVRQGRTPSPIVELPLQVVALPVREREPVAN